MTWIARNHVVGHTKYYAKKGEQKYEQKYENTQYVLVF